MKKILWPALALFLVIALVFVGGGWYFSDQIANGSLRMNRIKNLLDLEVVNINGDRITLRTTPDIKKDYWRTKGFWGLERQDGYDQVGDIISLNDQSVVREYIPLTGGLSPGEKVRFDHFAFPEDPFKAHGITFKDVYFSSTLDDFPAWFVEGTSDTWAIFVHGRVTNRDGRLEALRMLPVATGLGLPSLVITYRNDENVPQNPDGLCWFGLTEWQEVEGAVKYALEHEAKGIVLVGYSMGGGTVLKFLYESPQAGKIRGVILDSPMLDFNAVIDHGVKERSMPVIGTPVPDVITWIAKNLASIRFGIDYDELDYLSRADALDAPILLFHSDGDKTNPVESSDALAEKRSDIVQYVRNSGIDHVCTWNVLRGEYEDAVREFLLPFAPHTVLEEKGGGQ